MNHIHTFFLTFVILTIVYGILLLKMRQAFIEQIKWWAETYKEAAKESHEWRNKYNKKVVDWKKDNG